MKMGLINKLSEKGQLTVLLTAENSIERLQLNSVRALLMPVDSDARGALLTGSDPENCLVLPIEHLTLVAAEQRQARVDSQKQLGAFLARRTRKFSERVANMGG